MPARLILIRHGITEWNLKKRYCGDADVALSQEGKKQARKLYHRLKTERVHKIYSSDKRRALETANIIFKKQRIKKNPDLKEMHFGCFEGLTHKEIIKKYPKVYKKWLRDPFGTAIPEGERLADFKKRVVKAIKRIILVNPGKTIAVVCHGGVISVFMTHILKTRDFWKYIPKSTSLSIIDYQNNKPAIRLLNDIEYLIPPSAGCR